MRIGTFAGLLVGVALSAGLIAAFAQHDGAKKVKHVSPDKAEFKQVAHGVSKAVLWGDHDNGPYGAFTRFAPDTTNPTHTHTHDVRLVVLEGAYIYTDEEGEKRVSAGEFIQIPGGKTHVSAGDPDKGALFYEESQGGFDLVPAR